MIAAIVAAIMIGFGTGFYSGGCRHFKHHRPQTLKEVMTIEAKDHGYITADGVMVIEHKDGCLTVVGKK